VTCGRAPRLFLLLCFCVSSSNIADAKITYTNAGVYADSTQPGWLSKIFRQVTPF